MTLTARRVRSISLLLLGFASATVGRAGVAEITQTFVLQPGWNSVFLEVRPEPNDSESVFGGLPLASAWTWNPAGPKVEFIDNPAEQLAPSPQWLGYFPRPRPEFILTNLFAVQANRAYLLKIDGNAPVTWTVTGTPEVQTFRWAPDSFNLVGFPVDPQQQPTFGQYLAPSPAHTSQPIYQLSGGQWQEVVNPYATAIHSGEAYWVFCKGPSDYTGPISIELEGGKGMDFAAGLDRSRVRIRNLSTAPASISLTQLASPAPIPLAVRKFDPDEVEVNWPTLPQTYSLPVPQEGELLIDLAPKRASFGATDVGTVIEIKDGFGYRRLLAVSARGVFAPAPFQARRTLQQGARTLAMTAPSVTPLAGLWVGNVAIRAVSQAQTGSLTPTPTGGPFTFRVMVHVDASGTARLLKEVIQLWKEGTRIPDPENPGLFLIDEPGRFVILTDDSLVQNFTGAVLRDGEPVGYRVSTTAYDFEPQSLVMSGSFGTTGTLGASISLDAEAPTNPFREKFHPDHNNRNELYTEFLEEAYPVSRTMTFAFSSTDPSQSSGASFGSNQMGGTYHETISGLHRNDIVVEGIFSLNRVSVAPVLNE
ncbi:MAG: hypothetical protein ABIV06_06910 [Thermoanaerobaculia bacterium]